MTYETARGCTARRALWALAALAAASLYPGAALAQRGGDFVLQEPAPSSPRTGFPGAFNTQMVEKGRVVADLPFMQVDVGASENLSVGISLLPLTLVAAGDLPGGFGRLRYRIYDDGRISSVASLQGGYLRTPETDDEAWAHLWGLYASHTLGLRLSPRQHLAGTVLAATLRVASGDGFESHYLDGLALAADYEAFLTGWLGLNITVGGAAAIEAGSETVGSIASARFKLDLQDRLVVRALALLQPKDRWLFAVGGLSSLTLSYGLPWVSVARKW